MSTPDRLRFNAAELMHEYTHDSKGPSCTLQDMSPVFRSKATMLLACSVVIISYLQSNAVLKQSADADPGAVCSHTVSSILHAAQCVVLHAMSDSIQDVRARCA